MPLAVPKKKTVFAKTRRAEERAYGGKPKIEPIAQPSFETKRSGHRIPKGKSRFDKGVRPNFLTRKEAEEYDRQRRNFNKRVDRLYRSMKKTFPEWDKETMIKNGLIPAPMRKGVLDLENRRQFTKLKAKMRHYDTKKWKAEKRENAQNKYVLSLDRAYSFKDQDVKKWAKDVFANMSMEQLAKWQYDNPTVISDFFYAYQLEKAGKGDVIGEDEMNAAVVDLIESLKDYANKDVPESYSKYFE